MTNIRFNLPEDVIEELEEYVQETMPEGYATSLMGLIKFGLYHRMKSTVYEIFVEQPEKLLDCPDADAGEVRSRLLAVFTGDKGSSGEASCFYAPGLNPVAVLRIRFAEPVQVQTVVKDFPHVMLPLTYAEEDNSVSMMYLPSAMDKRGDIYDTVDLASGLADRDGFEKEELVF